VQIQGHANSNNYLEPAADGSISVSLGASVNTVLKTGQLTTTSTGANQVVLNYTVTSGKTLFLEYIDIQGRFTTLTPAPSAAVLGTVVIQLGGTTVYTGTFVNPTTLDSGSQAIRISISEPLPISAGTLVAFLVTPVLTTSMLWIANFGGYEK